MFKNKKQIFSIRKFNTGVGSVQIGAIALLLGLSANATTVNAELVDPNLPLPAGVDIQKVDTEYDLGGDPLSEDKVKETFKDVPVSKNEGATEGNDTFTGKAVADIKYTLQDDQSVIKEKQDQVQGTPITVTAPFDNSEADSNKAGEGKDYREATGFVAPTLDKEAGKELTLNEGGKEYEYVETVVENEDKLVEFDATTMNDVKANVSPHNLHKQDGSINYDNVTGDVWIVEEITEGKYGKFVKADGITDDESAVNAFKDGDQKDFDQATVDGEGGLKNEDTIIVLDKDTFGLYATDNNPNTGLFITIDIPIDVDKLLEKTDIITILKKSATTINNQQDKYDASKVILPNNTKFKITDMQSANGKELEPKEAGLYVYKLDEFDIQPPFTYLTKADLDDPAKIDAFYDYYVKVFKEQLLAVKYNMPATGDIGDTPESAYNYMIAKFDTPNEYTTPIEKISGKQMAGTINGMLFRNDGGLASIPAIDTFSTFNANSLAKADTYAPIRALKVYKSEAVINHIYKEVVRGSVTVAYVDKDSGTEIIAKKTIVDKEKVGGNYTTDQHKWLAEDGTVLDAAQATAKLQAGESIYVRVTEMEGEQAGAVEEGVKDVVYKYVKVKNTETDTPASVVPTVKYVIEGTEDELKDKFIGDAVQYTSTKTHDITTVIQDNGDVADDAKELLTAPEFVEAFKETVTDTPVTFDLTGKKDEELKDDEGKVYTFKGIRTGELNPTLAKDAIDPLEMLDANKEYPVVLEYELKKEKVLDTTTEVKGDVIVRYVNEAGEEIKDPFELEKQTLVETIKVYDEKSGDVVLQDNFEEEKVPTNATYDALPQQDKEIKHGDKEYVFSKLDDNSVPAQGDVKEGTQTVTYVYKEKDKGSVVVKFVDAADQHEIQGEVKHVTDEYINGQDYATTNPLGVAEITETATGKVYTIKGIKAGDLETAPLKAGVTTITYEYDLKVEEKIETAVERKGDVIVKFVNEDGDEIKPEIKHKDQELVETENTYHKVSGTFEVEDASKVEVVKSGATYDTDEVKEGTITAEDGKVYQFKEVDPNGAKPQGDVTVDPQTVTYIYSLVKEDVLKETKEVKGSLVVRHVIAGTDIEIVEANKPFTDTVIKTTKVIEVKSGEVVLETKEEVEETPQPFDTTPLFLDEIKANDGKVYVKKALKSGTEKGDLVEGLQEVVYEYELKKTEEVLPTVDSQKGSVIVRFVDKATGEEIATKVDLMTDAVVEKTTTTVTKSGDVELERKDEKEAIEVPYETKAEDVIEFNGRKYRKIGLQSGEAAGNVKPGLTEVVYEYELIKETTFVTTDGEEVSPKEEGETPNKDMPNYEFVETKVKPNGDVEHVYRKVTTTFVDEEGNEVSPPEEGTTPKKDIPEYEFVTTKKEPGKTVHVYKKVVKETPETETPTPGTETPTPETETPTPESETPVPGSATPEAKPEQSSGVLPKTGVENASVSMMIGLGMLAGSLGLAGKRYKKKR